MMFPVTGYRSVRIVNSIHPTQNNAIFKRPIREKPFETIMRKKRKCDFSFSQNIVYPTEERFHYFKLTSVNAFNFDQCKILSSGTGLNISVMCHKQSPRLINAAVSYYICAYRYELCDRCWNQFAVALCMDIDYPDRHGGIRISM